jgi:hypothetical protein
MTKLSREKKLYLWLGMNSDFLQLRYSVFGILVSIVVASMRLSLTLLRINGG